jgi:hypothetical protein
MTALASCFFCVFASFFVCVFSRGQFYCVGAFFEGTSFFAFLVFLHCLCLIILSTGAVLIFLTVDMNVCRSSWA